MASFLRKHRLSAGMTQAEVAQALGVSQPNYQRWESGNAPIPATKQKKLARTLNTTVEALLGQPIPFDLLGVDQDVPDERTYFGEVAFRFASSSILLPISEATRIDLLRQLQYTSAFIITESLDNRFAFIRRDAINDVFFSSEEYDEYGPDTPYEDYLDVRPDDDFWKIVEFSECLDFLEDEFDAEQIQNAMSQYQLTDVELDALVAKGNVAAGNRATVRKEANSLSERLFNRATTICWQFSSGLARHESTGENKELYENLSRIELDPDDLDTLIYLPLEGYHRTVMINKKSLDFIVVPKHKYLDGKIELAAEELDD